MFLILIFMMLFLIQILYKKMFMNLLEKILLMMSFLVIMELFLLMVKVDLEKLILCMEVIFMMKKKWELFRELF
jgi:hypothetical protein